MQNIGNGRQLETDDVDRDVRIFVDTLNAGYARFPGFGELPLAERRAVAEEIRAPWRRGGPVMTRTIDTEIHGVRARIHVPAEGEPLPAMLYMHGGGWTMFSIETHDRLMREYAARAGMVVVGLDYSLSPETKFPTAIDEIVGTLSWLRQHAAEIGILPDPIALGGDSAGGKLCVAESLKQRDTGEPLP